MSATDRGLNVIVLAAGYGTRLGTIAQNRPKGLLPLGGRPLMDRLLDGLAGTPHLRRLYVVTNRRFASAYRAWAKASAPGLSLTPTILDDGTGRPEDRLGAVGDLALGLRSSGTDEDVLVLVSDALFEFPLADLVQEFQARRQADVLLAIRDEANRRLLNRRGVVLLDGENRVTRFQEKPREPCSRATALPVYLLRSRVLPLVADYLESGGNPDAPGHLISWLVDRVRVEGYRVTGGRIDVGTPDGYREAERRFVPDPGPE